MDNKQIEFLLTDWKRSKYDAQTYLPERMKLWIRLSYAGIVFMFMLSIGLGAYAFYVMHQKSKDLEIASAHETENQELTFALRSLKEGASKLKAIDTWIESEFAVSSLLYSIIEKINTTKIDKILLTIPEDRSLVQLDIAATGSAQGITDAFAEISNKLKESNFSILSLDQPRYPGGSKLQIELKRKKPSNE